MSTSSPTSRGNCHCSNCRASTGSAVRRDRARQARDPRRSGHAARVGHGRREPHTVRDLRIAALFGRSGRRLRARGDGVAGRRPDGPSDRAHLRRLEGAVVRDHRRSAARRRTLGALPPRARGSPPARSPRGTWCSARPDARHESASPASGRSSSPRARRCRSAARCTPGPASPTSGHRARSARTSRVTR
jgi:hypothetical protein